MKVYGLPGPGPGPPEWYGPSPDPGPKAVHKPSSCSKLRFLLLLVH